MAQFVFEEDFVNEILSYLGTKPFVEVYGLMEKFKKLAPIGAEEKSPEDATPAPPKK